MKYGSYLVEGESAQGFYAVCVIPVTAEWVRDRNDCLWDGVGMRNHHSGNMFMLPVLVCTLTSSERGYTHVDTHKHMFAYMCTDECGASKLCSERLKLCILQSVLTHR